MPPAFRLLKAPFLQTPCRRQQRRRNYYRSWSLQEVIARQLHPCLLILVPAHDLQGQQANNLLRVA